MTEPTVRYITITTEQAGQRLDNFLITFLKGCPKSLIYRVIRKGEVRVNKKRAKPDYKLQADDEIRIPPVRTGAEAPPKVISKNFLAELEAAIIYEDEYLLVLNKPSGLAVHGGSGVNLGAIEALRQLRPNSPSLELVHRLDRDTSGCLMVAKKRSALRHFHALIRNKEITKRYYCLVAGRWPRNVTRVDAPLLKNTLQSGERMVVVSKDGKASETHFKILSRHLHHTHVQAELITGRTHQIRVHAAHIGCPVMGDAKYGNKDVLTKVRALGFKQLFLHAQSIEFTLPTGASLAVVAPVPVYFGQLCQLLQVTSEETPP